MVLDEKLKKHGIEIISRLIDNGFQGYFVGGYIRDNLLKREINDIDIATDAHPEKVMSIFSRVIPTGLKHGTVTVLIDNSPFEVTTFRSEGKYLDYRRPAEVFFVSNLDEDLKRRDFTINAMAMTIDGQIIDPYNGRTAIENKLITAVGPAEDRFSEDPLRMLRAIRFAAQLNFTIEKNTWKSIVDNSPLLRYIANERIKIELFKIINSANPDLGIELLIKSNMINWIKGLENIRVSDDMLANQVLSKTDDVIIRIVMLLNSFSISERRTIMKQLRFSNMEINNINRLFSAIELIQIDAYNNLKASLIKTDLETCQKAIDFLNITGAIEHVEMEKLLTFLSDLDSTLTVRKSTDLVLTGRDLIEVFNRPSGPWLNRVLEMLTYKVQYEGLPNEYEQLLKTTEKYLSEENRGVEK